MTNATKLAQDVAERLEGTCDSLANVLEEMGVEEMMNNLEFCSLLDMSVFCCEECNWWFEMTETEDLEWTCSNCADDQQA